jgi:hypothetical protein
MQAKQYIRQSTLTAPLPDRELEGTHARTHTYKTQEIK